MTSTYPLVTCSGFRPEMGRQHGEQCRAAIRGFLDYLQATLRLSRGQLRERALRFLPLFEGYCPTVVEEIRGLAEGAGLPLADALAVQIRGEAAQVPDGACTTFVLSGRATADGQILIGQNSDLDPEVAEYSYVLHLQPIGRTPVMMWTFGGMLGYHGLNSSGVAHFANALGGGPAWKWGLPHYPVKRLMLEQHGISEIMEVLRQVPVCSSGNYVLCDGHGRIADIELTPGGFELIEDDGSGFITHTNHFLCGGHACEANYAVSVQDSFPRQERVRALVRENFARITVETMQKILADHEGHPTSICRHAHAGPDHPSVNARGRTVASLIAEPNAGRLHAARGNPCEVAYQTYELG